MTYNIYLISPEVRRVLGEAPLKSVVDLDNGQHSYTIYIYIYILTYVYIYIYIYMYREGERERERDVHTLLILRPTPSCQVCDRSARTTQCVSRCSYGHHPSHKSIHKSINPSIHRFHPFPQSLYLSLSSLSSLSLSHSCASFEHRIGCLEVFE